MKRRVPGSAPAPYPETFSDEQAYGKAAERYNAERELGRRALEILRENERLEGGQLDHQTILASACNRIAHEARALGLLDENGGAS